MVATKTSMASLGANEAADIEGVADAEARIRDDIAALGQRIVAELHEVHKSLLRNGSNLGSSRAMVGQPTALSRGRTKQFLQLGQASPHPGRTSQEFAPETPPPPHIASGISQNGSTLGAEAASGAAQVEDIHIQESDPTWPYDSHTLAGAETEATQVGVRSKFHGRWEGWPANLCLREDLMLAYEEENMTRLRDFAQTCAARELSTQTSYVERGAALPFTQYFRVIHPASKRRIAFDVATVFVIFLQVVYLPYALVWQEQVEDIDAYVLLCTSLFWMCDMALHFTTGYYASDGEAEMRLKLVVKHYLRTWFPPDFLCAATDLINLTIRIAISGDSSAGAARVLHLVKIQRFLRALVMLRMLRVAKVLYDYMESQLSATWIMVLRTTQFFMLIFWLTHVVACVWFAIGRYAPAGPHGIRWIHAQVPGTDERLTVDDTDVIYQYMTSYHWSLAQITLGGLDVNPTTSWERFLAIICNFFGLLFGGVVVSILSTTMIELRERNRDLHHKLRKLREFLLQREVEIGMRLKVIRKVNERMRVRGRTLVEKDVTALQMISVTVLRDLRYHMLHRHIIRHPLLHSWNILQADTLKFLCGEGVELVVLLPDDELFSAGMESKAAYFLIEGETVYTQTPMDGLVTEDQLDTLREGAWISEATWWSHWLHVGTACAREHCTLLSLPAETVLDTMRRDPVISAVTMEYGTRFHHFIVNSRDTFVTDVNLQYADFNGLLCTLPSEVHVILGMAALQQVVSAGLLWKLARNIEWKKLEDEVREGRSLVMLDHNQELHRRVAVSVLQIEKELPLGGKSSKSDADEQRETLRLTEVAQFSTSTSEWRPDIRLPGVKQRNGEGPAQAFRRILETRICQSPDSKVTPTEWRRSIEIQASKQYGIGTQYIKTTCIVPLDDELEDELSKFSVPVCLDAAIVSTKLSSSKSKKIEMISPANTYQSWMTFEELPERVSQVESMYIMPTAGNFSLYVWTSEVDFDRLKKSEAQLAKLVAGLLSNVDSDFMTRFTSDHTENLIVSSMNVATDLDEGLVVNGACDSGYYDL